MNRTSTNRYSLSSESPRWWWLPATAGTAGLAAVTLVFLLPVAGSQAVTPPAPDDPGATTQLTGDYVERPCYLARPGWNDWDWEQPVCRTYLRGPSHPADPLAGHAVVRQLDTLP